MRRFSTVRSLLQFTASSHALRPGLNQE